MVYAPGKVRLDAEFETEKASVVVAAADGSTSKPRIADLPMSWVVMLSDGEAVYNVTYSSRINPTGCQIERFSTLSQAVSVSQFPIQNVARPQLEALDITKLIDHLGADAIASIAIATQQGQVKQQIDVVDLFPNKAQAVNVPDNESGKTCVAEIELSKGEIENAIIRLKVISINGPKKFPVTTNVVMFDGRSRIVACGEQSQSIRVDGRPSVNDLTIDVGKLQKFSNVRYAAIPDHRGRSCLDGRK